jgi:hypothetical protein
MIAGSRQANSASATELLQKVNTIPFAQIGKNLDGTLQAVNNVANGPELRQALTGLTATIASIGNVVRHLDNDMTPALQRLPEIAADVQKTMANANRLVRSLDNGYGDNTQSSTATSSGCWYSPTMPSARSGRLPICSRVIRRH